MKVLLIILMVTTLNYAQSNNIITPVAKIDSKGGGGGDLNLLENQSNLERREDSIDYYKKQIFKYGSKGLDILEKLSWKGFQFKNGKGEIKKLSVIKIREAIDVLHVFMESQSNLKIDSTLINPQTGEARMMQNSSDETLWLNPIEFGSQLEEKYGEIVANNIRTAIVTHEFLSLVGLEHTGEFVFSKKLLGSNEVKAIIDNYDQDINNLFQNLESIVIGTNQKDKIYYSCIAEAYRIENNKKELVWSTDVPIRTYLTWSLGKGHMDTTEDGKPLLVNPNYVIGTSAGCYSDAPLRVNGLISQDFTNDEAFNHLLKVDKNSYLDICYVVGDPGPSYSKNSFNGDGQFLLRKRKKDEWYKFDYVTPETYISGNSQASLMWKDYQVDIMCQRASRDFKILGASRI